MAEPICACLCLAHFHLHVLDQNWVLLPCKCLITECVTLEGSWHTLHPHAINRH
jgi:hypothetical protein